MKELILSICLAFYAVVILNGCHGNPPGATEIAAELQPQIDRIEPTFTVKGSGFNVQPDGMSVIIAYTRNPTGQTVFWNGQALKTSVHPYGAVGVVPAALISSPGIAKIELRTANGKVSNSVSFTIYDVTGPAPKITELYPPGARAGQTINRQPDGRSAIGVTGEGFLPGAVLSICGKTVKGDFARPTYLSAAFPQDCIQRAGNVAIIVRNPDGKSSNSFDFRVESKP